MRVHYNPILRRLLTGQCRRFRRNINDQFYATFPGTPIERLVRALVGRVNRCIRWTVCGGSPARKTCSVKRHAPCSVDWCALDALSALES